MEAGHGKEAVGCWEGDGPGEGDGNHKVGPCPSLKGKALLSRLVITFLPRSECLLISWLQSPPAVILEPRKIKSDTVSPSICHEVMGLDAMIFVF